MAIFFCEFATCCIVVDILLLFVMAIMLQKCLIYKKKCGKKSGKCLLFRKKVVLLHADYYQAGVNSANL